MNISSSERRPRGHYLIQGGQVLTMDRNLGNFACGDILVRDGEIIAVGPTATSPPVDAADIAWMKAWLSAGWTHAVAILDDATPGG